MSSNQLSTEQVQHIAKLAHIALTEEEIERYRTELSTVFEYIDQLNEVDTEGVPVTSQVTGLENVWREDEIVDEYTREQMLASAIDQAEDHLKVNKVL